MFAQNLSSLRVGERAVIRDIAAEETVRQRMYSMGLRAGREALVMRRGHLGGPLQVRVGSITLVVRRRDAARVEVASLA
jgi:ferrous iron transport protein A